MDLLARAKGALRIKTDAMDDDLNMLIIAAKSDLSAAGVEKVDDADELTATAICFYLCAYFGYVQGESERFERAYEGVKLTLALSGKYKEQADAVN